MEQSDCGAEIVVRQEVAQLSRANLDNKVAKLLEEHTSTTLPSSFTSLCPTITWRVYVGIFCTS